jgi:hypothetical protein
MSTRPGETEYAPFFAGYMALVPEEDVLAVLEGQVGELLSLPVRSEKETYRYAPGKWSVREVVGHMADAERVFGYRAFCISRGEKASLPGFDEDAYVARSSFDTRPLRSLVEELCAARRANLPLLRAAGEEAWRQTGTANGKEVSVRALAFIMAGHVRHHLKVLRERYGVDPGGPS